MNTKTDTTYNGWTNYETWRVHLEIFDDLCPDHEGDIATADECKDYAITLVDNGSAEGFALDFAMAFLSAVNWQEIAEAINDK